MSQADFEIANQGFPSFRSDLNSNLQALASNSAGATEPSTTFAYQFWYDETTDLLKLRNSDDDAWITLAAFDQTNDEWEIRSAVIQAVDSAGLALKTDEGTTRFSISDAGVVSFENYEFPSADGSNGQVLTTDGSGTLTFEDGGAGDKIEEGNSSVEVVDTGTGFVAVTVDGTEEARFTATGLGIGTTSPSVALQIASEGKLRVYRGDNARYGDLFTDNDALRIQTSTDPIVINAKTGGVRFESDGTEVGRFFSDGNLKFNSGYGSVATAYGCRAWINFDGGTVAIRESGNVSSITDNATGDYRVNFSTAFVDNNYCINVTGQSSSSGAVVVASIYGSSTYNQLTTALARLLFATNAGSAIDPDVVCVSVVR